ncbi:MAG: CBS domain-containing protein [Deltaproteobacteria bacterium]|jgi:CBS domain-containing protein|nr:CBS domain-containing protein [Deltaproteobacteria bacterium]
MSNKTQISNRVDLESLKKLQETRDSLKKVETFPYRENLRSIMNPDVYTCTPLCTLREVIKDMAAKEISSVIIIDHEKQPVGIMTERDIMKRVIADKGVSLDLTPIAKVMTSDPITLHPDNSIYRALSVLSDRSVKHLPLVEDGRIVGVVTMRQLLKLRYPEPLTLIEGIQDAQKVETLKEIKNRLPQMAQERIDSGRSAYDVVTMISLINRDIHRRALDLAADGLGQPPVPFCLYLTGSHGRLENLLTPDQDHGMIIMDSEQNYQYDQYFIDLGVRFSDYLDQIGYAYCPGYLMASNPLWRKSLSEWKLQINYWFEAQVRELGRYVTVLFDASAIAGEVDLFNELKDYAFAILGRHHEVFRVLHEEEGGHRVPLGFLGGFVTDKEGLHKGQLDVKKSGLIFVVETIRILSLQHNIRETATLKRIAKLVEKGVIHSNDGEYYESAYQVLLHYALKSQVSKSVRGEKLDTYIDPKILSPRDKETLKHALKAVATLQDFVAAEFGQLVI